MTGQDGDGGEEERGKGEGRRRVEEGQREREGGKEATQLFTCTMRVAAVYNLGLLSSSPLPPSLPPSLLPAGIKIVQQIAILMGCAVLPHLKSLVEIVENGLVDEQQKVRTITALSLAALAEAATPYGIEAFDSVLVRLWKGIR